MIFEILVKHRDETLRLPEHQKAEMLPRIGDSVSLSPLQMSFVCAKFPELLMTDDTFNVIRVYHDFGYDPVSHSIKIISSY